MTAPPAGTQPTGFPVAAGCSDSVGSADMRLRLEPVINLSEQVSLHAQIDLLDNLVLGATPSSYGATGSSAGLDVGTSGQLPPQSTSNYATDSIRVKRAWGEVIVPDLGVVRFGRMPEQWGLGMLHNGGGADPLHGTVCLDCDSGETVDHRHRLELQRADRRPGRHAHRPRRRPIL